MKAVMTHIMRRKVDYQKLPLFTTMRDERLPPIDRIAFMRQFAFFIMAFSDFNKYLLRDDSSGDLHQQAINTHADEDACHWAWYLEDFEKLGWNVPTTMTDAMRALWSDDTSRNRVVMYELSALVRNASAIERLAIVEAIEETGNVLFALTARLAAPLETELGEPLRYLGDFHFERENGHMQNGEHARFARIALDDARRSRCIELVDSVFDSFTAWAAQAVQHIGGAMPSNGAAPELPRHDDKPVYDVALNLFLYPSIIIAHRLGLFRLLDAGPGTLADVQAALALERRPSEALVNAAVALGFAQRRGDRFALTPLGRDLLSPSSHTYFGHFWDLMYENGDAFSIKGLESALRRDRASAYGGSDIFESHERDETLSRQFTRAMQSLSASHGPVWPTRLDLSDVRTLLDIGGGSGVHLAGALAAWPSLEGTLFDLAAVCEQTKTFMDPSLRDRIRYHAGDMWRDPFPDADLHFFSNIVHDWTPEKNAVLLAKSFASLPSGGRIVLHEILYRGDKSGPPAAAAYSLMMMGWTEGQQYSSKELASMLSKAGFTSIETIPSFGYYSLVTALKP